MGANSPELTEDESKDNLVILSNTQATKVTDNRHLYRKSVEKYLDAHTYAPPSPNVHGTPKFVHCLRPHITNSRKCPEHTAIPALTRTIFTPFDFRRSFAYLGPHIYQPYLSRFFFLP